jgi:hypothetical protein
MIRSGPLIPAYEKRDAPPATVLGWRAALMLALVLFAAGVWLTVDVPGAGVTPPEQASVRKPAAPRLQASPAAEAAAYQAAMEEKLGGYDWVDKAQGVARIPVKAAMELLAEQGWPADPVKAGAP